VAAEVDELKRKMLDKEASEVRLMVAGRDRSREDSQAQSQIDQLIEMFSTLAARQQPGSVHIASSTATFPPVGVPSRSVGDYLDYSEYARMKAGETRESFEATMSAEAARKRRDAQFATAYSAWRRFLRMYSVSERDQHQRIGYAFAGTAKASFLKISSESKHADATPEALWKVMAKQLYNGTMVRSQRGAFTSAKLDSGETIDDLSESLQNLAVGLPELEGASGDAVLMQRFTYALPEELQVHACGISGEYDHLVASLSRNQKTLGKKYKPGVTWRARCGEQVNEILDRASVYHNDDLSI
jgi:hypothetical protein